MTSQDMIKLAEESISLTEKHTEPGLLYNRYIRETRYAMQCRLDQVEHTSWWGTDVEGMKQRSLAYPLAELVCAMSNPRCTMIDVEKMSKILLEGDEKQDVLHTRK